MTWLHRLYRLARWVFRISGPRLPREVDARLQQYEMERHIRMARYAVTWRRKWAEQGIVREQRARFRRVP